MRRMRRLERLAICIALLTLGSLRADAQSVFVRLKIEPHSDVLAAVRRAGLDEAARIWAPYGVFLSTSDVVGACRGPLLPVAVIFEEDSAGAVDGLGAIRFDERGAPEARVRLFYARIAALAMVAGSAGAPLTELPNRLRDEALGRALGRALAHEIGHYVLRWPHHSATGLMRPEYHTSLLVDRDRRAFTLTAAERARLAIAREAATSAPDALAVSGPCAPTELVTFTTHTP